MKARPYTLKIGAFQTLSGKRSEIPHFHPLPPHGLNRPGYGSSHRAVYFNRDQQGREFHTFELAS